MLLLGVGLDVEDHLGAHAVLPAGLHSVAVLAVGGPAPGLLAPVGPGGDGHLIGHHKGRVEAHAELSDDVHIALALAGVLGGHVFFKLEGTALGDGAQIFLQFVMGHADAVVRDGQGTGDLIGGEGDLELVPLHPHLVVGEGFVGQLVNGVAGVGDELPQENLLMGVDGVDHQVQQPVGFGLKFLLFHRVCASI